MKVTVRIARTQERCQQCERFADAVAEAECALGLVLFPRKDTSSPVQVGALPCEPVISNLQCRSRRTGAHKRLGKDSSCLGFVNCEHPMPDHV